MAVVYPTYPVTTLAQAEDMLVFTGNRIHDIMNADATSVIEVEDGQIPSIRKALVDNMYFKTPQIWVASTQITDPLQLKQFTDGGWYFAPTATVSTPVNLGATPIGDTNWKPWSKDQAAVYQHAKRLAAEAGYNMVSGSFYFGGTLDSVDDVLFYEGDGKYYSWSGAFPKVVPAGSTPATSGGVGAGAWVDRTDVSLRAEITPSVTEALRRSYADAGYNLVDGSFESGGTLTNTNDVLLHKASGIAYSWGWTLPITVAPNSTPTPIGSDGWIDRSAVTLRSDVTAHEAKAGAHAISGVAGLQDALDGKASASELSSISSSVAAIGTRVTALETIKSYCLVNALGTGAPNELVSAALPANIAINTRYVLANPFGANVPVIGWAEVFFNGKWSQTGFIYNTSPNGGYGVSFNFVQGEGIVIQTGTIALLGSSSHAGGGHGVAGASPTSAPCRVFIQKLGA